MVLSTNWDAYLGDPARTHYLFNPNNSRQCESAGSCLVTQFWWASQRSLLYSLAPLIVDGVLYGLSPRLVAFALDAATGEELWRYSDGGDPSRD